MKKCKCEHWQTCPVCYPQGFDEAGNRKPVEIPPTRDEMLARIKELEAELLNKEGMVRKERDALAMQNQQMREALTLWKIASDNSEEVEFDEMAAYSIPMPLFCNADEATEAALVLPDNTELEGKS